MCQMWCKNFELQRVLYLFTLSLEQQTFDDNAWLDDIYSRGYHTLGLLLGSIFGSIVHSPDSGHSYHPDSGNWSVCL